MSSAQGLTNNGSKEKERSDVKKPLTDPPEKLSELERRRVRIWCQKKYPAYEKRLARLWNECRDWHLKKGEQAANWEAAMRMWVRQGGRLREAAQSRAPAAGRYIRRPDRALGRRRQGNRGPEA